METVELNEDDESRWESENKQLEVEVRDRVPVEREAGVLEYPQRLQEIVKVRIVDGMWLGLAFGFGLGMALVIYGLIGFVIFVTIIKELMA